MKEYKKGFVEGMAICLLLVILILNLFVEDPLSNIQQCHRYAVQGIELVWQEESPYCHVPVEMNGEMVLMELWDYEKYQEEK